MIVAYRKSIITLESRSTSGYVDFMLTYQWDEIDGLWHFDKDASRAFGEGLFPQSLTEQEMTMVELGSDPRAVFEKRTQRRSRG